MFVLGQLAPHAAVDAVAKAGDIGCWRRRVFGGVKRGEDELGRVQFGDMR